MPFVRAGAPKCLLGHGTGPLTAIRTTTDEPGYAHGIAVGSGPRIDAALANLAEEARRQAEEIVLGLQDRDYGDDADAEWQFEVIGMRLIPGHQARADEAWCAHGTLTSNGRSPWAASPWGCSQ